MVDLEAQENNMKSHYIECDCHSTEHTIKFLYDEDEKDLYFEVQLCQTKSFWGRVWAAIKYVFGYECRYGHWDCFLFSIDEAKATEKILQRFINDKTNEQANSR